MASPTTIEILESRVTPALILDPLVTRGILQIFTDSLNPQNEIIVVTQTGPGAFTIEDQVNAETIQVTGVKGLFLDNQNATDNSFTLNLLGDALPGGVRIAFSDGDNSVYIHAQAGGASVLGAVDIKTGTGNDLVRFGGSEPLVLKKNLTFTGNAFGSSSRLTAEGSVSIGGSVKVITATGFDFSAPGNIAGSLLLDQRDLPAASVPLLTELGFSVRGSVTFLGGEGDDALSILAPLTGALKFTGGAGIDKLIVNAPVKGRLTADFGENTDFFEIGARGSIGGTANLGAGSDVFSLEPGAAQFAKLTVLGGAGDDNFSLKGGAFLAAPLILDGGEGEDLLSLSDDFTATALLTFRGGAGADDVVWGNAKTLAGISLQLGDGANAIHSLVPGSTPYVAGLVDIQSGTGGLNFSPAQFAGIAAWKFTLKGGNNVIDTALDASSLTILGGSGVDNFTFHDSVIGRLSIALGAGDDSLTFGASVFTSAPKLDGGAGADTLTGLALYNRSIKGFETLL